MEQPRPDPTRTSRLEHVVTRPVFTDPSGRRRRLIVIAGAGASVLCIAALIMVGAGLVGGPNTPFTLWGAPHSPTSHSRHADRAAHARKSSHPSGPGLTGQRSSSPGATPTPKTDSSPTPSASASPTPTKTPPGQGRTKHSHTPNPHSPTPKHSVRFAHAG